MKFAFLLFKLLITVSLCYWLFSNIEFQTLQQSLEQIGVFWMVAGVLLHIAVYFLGALRWWQLLTHIHTTTPFLKAFPSYYLGVFFNNFLPTGIGGDTVRILHLRVRGISTKSLVSSTVVDRVIGILTVMIMALCGVLISENLGISNHTRIVLIVFFVAGLLIIGVLLSDRSVRFVDALADKYRHKRVRTWLLDIVLACYSYRSTKSRIAFAFALSIIGQSLIILTYYMLGRGLGLDLPLVTYFVAIPAVFLAASLPISIGGLGVREGTLVGILIASGADLKIAINLSLAYLLVLWTSSVPGGLVILFSRMRKNDLVVTVKKPHSKLPKET